MRDVFIAAAAHHRAGRLSQAEQGYRQVLAADPRQPDALHMLGLLAYQTGKSNAAVELIGRAISVHGENASYHSNLGLALKDLGQLPAAEDAFRRAIALNPKAPEPYNNLGIVLTALGRWDAALGSSAKALELLPGFADAHVNIGHVRRQQGALDLAIAQYRIAIELRPDFAEAHTSLAHALLQGGAFAEGWAEYEWRWQTQTMQAGRRDFTQPQWRGEAGHGGVLLIHAEQGFGDTLQFCRFVHHAAERNWRVIFEVKQPLVRLLSRLAGAAQVIGQGDPLPSFDRHVPLLSLPAVLGLRLDDLPGRTNYLQPDPALVSRWRERLGGSRRQVGLAWAGSHTAANAAIDARRSIDLARLAPIFEMPGIGFVSLQKDAPAPLPMLDPMPEVSDFADTAALMAGLDLVIAVDTAVAHLAGGLGKPVWMLNRFDSCWRWLPGRDDSPWYPAMRIYQQPAPHNWEIPIAEIARDLAALLASAQN